MAIQLTWGTKSFQFLRSALSFCSSTRYDPNSPFRLNDLPLDIIKDIIDHLDRESLKSLRLTSRILKEGAEAPLFKSLYITEESASLHFVGTKIPDRTFWKHVKVLKVDASFLGNLDRRCLFLDDVISMSEWRDGVREWQLSPRQWARFQRQFSDSITLEPRVSQNGTWLTVSPHAIQYERAFSTVHKRLLELCTNLQVVIYWEICLPSIGSGVRII